MLPKQTFVMLLKPAVIWVNMANRENVYLLLGFNMKTNPIEILYNEFGENGVNVFHAMACQSRFLRLFEEGEYYDGN
jgi:hypothetical protein